MAPIAASLARSESKAKFFTRIGLEENNRIHRQLYATMKAEAVQGWLRMTNTRDALLPTLRDDPAIGPPYTYAQINEPALRAEVVRIYEQASTETKILYNLANDGGVTVDENWIIRWLLWHVFRYRDDRNCSVSRSNRAAHSLESPGNPRPDSTPPTPRPVRSLAPTRLPIHPAPVDHSARTADPNTFWDPVREAYRVK